MNNVNFAYITAYAHIKSIMKMQQNSMKKQGQNVQNILISNAR